MFEFVRNIAIGANRFVSNGADNLKQNQGGFTFGGSKSIPAPQPICRTFFPDRIGAMACGLPMPAKEAVQPLGSVANSAAS
jgi:hypothetical protein